MKNAFKCIIVDDEPLARKVIREYLDELPELEIFAELKSALELKKFIESNDADIIFLDINMPKLSGLDSVKSFTPNAHIVFTTAYPDYAVDAFEIDAADYLVKPISFERFLKSIDKIKSRIENNDQSADKNWIAIKENKRLYKLEMSDIHFIQAYGDYVKVITAEKNYVTKEKLSSFHSKLNERFMQCHRSYIVNIDRLEYIEGNHLVIADEKIPLSGSYKDEVLRKFK